MKKIILLLALTVIVGCSEEKTEVLVLPTLHSAHEINQNYSYEDLMKIIETYNPDVIGVEIIPEDLDLETALLNTFYPWEMVSVRDSFPQKTKGIDYYSEGSRNTVVSREMFSDPTSQLGQIKKLSQDMMLDSALVAEYEKTDLPEILQEQKRIARNYSPQQFLRGEYDSLTQRQYQIEDSLFKNSIYERYSDFNNNRDLQITRNAIMLIAENRQKKILILVGANHRNRLVDSLETKESVELVEDLDFQR